jgi:hypothetical protein
MTAPKQTLTGTQDKLVQRTFPSIGPACLIHALAASIFHDLITLQPLTRLRHLRLHHRAQNLNSLSSKPRFRRIIRVLLFNADYHQIRCLRITLSLSYGNHCTLRTTILPP